MIRIRDLVKSYTRGDESIVACEVTKLDIKTGEQVALVGRSGCGKSTLLNLLAGMSIPDQGSIRIRDVEITQLSETGRDSFRAENMGMIFQTFNLLQPFTALENVTLGSVFGRGGGGQLKTRAAELLKQVGLGDRLHHRPNELSVGQSQRVAICRALINDPTLILADEPLGNQDRETGREVLQLLLDMARAEKRTVVMVTHSPESAAQLDRTVEFSDLRGLA
jgi:putative ABC transport system ATP-binding protein